MSADSIPLLDAHTQFLALQKRVDDQEKQIGSLQRSLCCTLRLLGNLKRTEELVKLLPPPPLPSPKAPFPKVVENPEALLSSVEDLREKKSETACRVLFAVFFPHLQDVRSRFEKKKTEIADLVGKWSVFCAGRGDRKRADWLSSLSPEEVHLFKALTHHELPTEWKVPVNPVEGKWPPLFPVLSAYASRDFFSFCKLLLLNPNPSRLAQQLMVPVLLGRPGALSVPSSGYSNAPFEDILPSLNLIAPLDANFLSFRSHALAVLWNAALGSPKLVGVKELCRWLATASHVADSETVERVAALGSAKGRKVARQIENFLHRSGGRSIALSPSRKCSGVISPQRFLRPTSDVSSASRKPSDLQS
uniref:Uncharacterized protein n=1 Tax=Chromera velia CCMP2878 TaxID=1169474 RepID=A0A0G4H9I8_9ALVE|eukprot:Cvel_5990.t1-p1 / transcript=Cvel_5990.t1 / gene=Cvel_5990 / organism=Chromera_velia_CCMP2878 / gene_product=hypothetical protein / transcript_product=hypothetical protein / location=Cvel_scaffold287:4164-5246(+) / protein_length=361 / sequence_SO=supercontig / SO=protein_coding / is_pseudo=false